MNAGTAINHNPNYSEVEMKRVTIMTMLAVTAAVLLAGSLAWAQEVEIPVIYDRSYLENRPTPYTEEWDEDYKIRMYDLNKSEIALSPDGKLIAFITDPIGASSTYNTCRDIAIVPAEGGEPVFVYSIPPDQLFNVAQDILPPKLAKYIGTIKSIAFTPDSKGITFCREYYDPVKGSQYETHFKYSPSPDGEGFTLSGGYTETNAVPTIEQVDIATGEVTTIIEEGTAPSWSADGRYLAYVHYDHNHVTNPSQANHNGVPAIYDTVTGETRFMTDEPSTYTSSGSDWYGTKYLDVLISEDNTELIYIVDTIIDGHRTTSLRRRSIETSVETVMLGDISNAGRFLNRVPGGRYITYTDFIREVGMLRILFVDLQTNESVWAFLENLDSNECGFVTPDGGSMIYLGHYHFEWWSEDGKSHSSSRNASKVCRQPIDIAVRFAVGNAPLPPELPDNYGVLAEFGTMMSTLPTGSSSNGAPIWSPDGQHIAFTVDHSDGDKIYTVPAEGGESVLVYDNPPETFQDYPLKYDQIELCGYTPDGNEILFNRNLYDEARGSVPELTVLGGGYAMSWHNPLKRLYAVNVNTGEVRTVIDVADIGAFSPDGRYLAYNVPGYTHDSGVPFVEAHKNQTIIRDLATDEETFLNIRAYMRYHWTPDSKALVINTGPESTAIVPIDGSEPVLIASIGPFNYDLTPDLKYMVFQQSYYTLYSMNLATGETTRITPDVDGRFWFPALSPDGTKIAYNVSYNGKSSSDPYNPREVTRLFVRDLERPIDVIPTSVADAAPAAELLIANYPNPFNPSTTISFSLPVEGHASIDIFSLNGQKVRELVNDTLTAGLHEVVWDGRSDYGDQLASGMYIARIAAGNQVASQRMLLMK